MRSISFRVTLAVGLCALLLGCATQTMVNSSASAVAPAISWIVQVVDTGASTTINGSGSVTAPRGSQVRVFIHAKSPSGVKTVTDGTFVDATWTCVSSGSLAQGMDATLAGATQSQTPNAQNQVDEDLVLFQVFSTGFDCNPGFKYSGGSIDIDAKATNFANKSTTASLSIKVPK